MNSENTEIIYNNLYTHAQRVQSSAKVLSELKNLPLSNEFCYATIRNEGLMAQHNIYGILEKLDESTRVSVMQNAYIGLECIKTQCEMYGNQSFFAPKVELYNNIINVNHEIMLSKYLEKEQDDLAETLSALPSVQRDYFQNFIGKQLVENAHLSGQDNPNYTALENIFNTSVAVCPAETVQ